MKQQLSLTYFILLFPAIFFYSSGVASSLITPILGGGFGFFAALTLATLSPSLLMRIPTLSGNALIMTFAFASLSLYTTTLLIANYLLHKNLQNINELINQYLTLLATWTALFAIGFFWPKSTPVSFRALNFVFLCGIFLVITLNIDRSNMIFALGTSQTEMSLSYQGLARSTAFTGLALLALIKDKAISAIVALILLFSLFFIGARAELVGVIATLPFIAYLHFKARPISTLIISIILGVILLAFFVYFYDTLKISRHFEIFNIASSSSGSARIEMHRSAMESIKDSPLLGNFGGHAQSYEGVGSYAHNIISAWRQLGVLGFSLYCFLMIGSIVIPLKELKKGNYRINEIPQVAATLSIFSLVLMIGAKSVFWSFPALAWGMTVACSTTRPSNSSAPP